ncbi:GNAT family N-acetyltransferase [Herbidospora galbida]|uniref:GNAT family N-acetyltransferase n=1 Tax=Herbidospora galbida TaxID=2575442 RepID=A0A4U3M0G4_9ACTN|nr:GNAT family N-acetyltransferase [Herbidospora galbida]TKK80726.1 GNAT family N-acetyltransferase [Herbidospora galbida]
MAHVLDNPGWAALTGPHAHLAEVRGGVRRYQPDVSVFLGVPGDPNPEEWAAIASFAGPGGTISLTFDAPLPDGWEIVQNIDGVQLDGSAVWGQPFDEAVVLTPDDVPDMLDLVARTEPGPFLPRTIEMGTYLGVRHEGKLVAMAGERLHPPGWTEISAVCTDASFRGQGLATRLVLGVAAGIRARGETPFMHASASNVNAIRLYEKLGFTLRARRLFRQVRVPAG